MTTHTNEEIQHVAELVDKAKIGMLTTMTTDGRHVSRPMALQETGFDGDLWFFAYDDSDKATQITANPQVNVAFVNDKGGEWTSLSGTAELTHDREMAEKLWSAPLKAWFPDELDTPGLVLIKVHAESAEYWEGPSSKVARLLGAARAAASGDPDKFPSRNEEVSL